MNRRPPRGHGGGCGVVAACRLLTFALVLLVLAASASAASAAPVWNVESQALPASFQSSDTSDSAQNVLVNATGGLFTLSFEGQTTHALDVGVGAEAMRSALDELSTIGGAGGSVTATTFITRGSESQEIEYLVTFAGTLGGSSVPLMTAAGSSLSGGSHTASVSYSTNDAYEIDLENLGSSASSGTIIVEDQLPRGVTTAQSPQGISQVDDEWTCSEGAGQSLVTCRSNATIPPAAALYDVAGPGPEAHTAAEAIIVPVVVSPAVGETVVNSVTVSGGGAVGVATSHNANPANATLDTGFGAGLLNLRMINAEGGPAMEAGEHPYAVTTDLDFSRELNPKLPGFTDAPLRSGHSSALAPYVSVPTGAEPKTIVAELPLGLIGDPQAAPKCPVSLFDTYGADPPGVNQNNCPPDTRVGVVYTNLLHGRTFSGPYQVFNLVPEAGHAAEFGIDVLLSLPVVLYGDVVHSSRGYVLRVTGLLPEAGVTALSLTFFGDPSAAFSGAFSSEEEQEAGNAPFLTNPVDCAASEEARSLWLHVDTWTAPGEGDPFEGSFSDPAWAPASAVLPAVSGCGALRFAPSLALQPATSTEGGTTEFDSPSGYDINLHVPQTQEYGSLATPELKTARVMLPAGLSVSPSAAGGLEVCSADQIALESNEAGKCPLGSKLGTVKITTPLLEEALEGGIFLGTPECGATSACTEADASEGKTFRLYIEVDSTKLGIDIKLPGRVKANPTNGQLTAEFAENPQLPFSDLELHFKNGPRAPLANPQTCGKFTTVSSLEPWSAPETPTATSESLFNITGCGASLPLAPAFTAGTASPAAGAFSPLMVSVSRKDGEQNLGGITVQTPAGLLGKIAGIRRCGEAQANAGTCSPASQIGTATVSAGPGSDPYTIEGGRVYLTDGYGGQPFGLSIAVPAEAGPFKLAGNTGTGLEVVRATIAVNPATSALTITSSPLPQIIDGVPLRLRTINVSVNRPDFTFNATNCTAQAITATLTGEHPIGSGEPDKTSSSSAGYEPSGCANLPFKPSFSASTQGKTSRKEGASLDVKVAQAGGEANIHKVEVQLPKILPARLEPTLKHACSEQQFAADPSGCPEDSVAGTATAITPLLNVPLKGPAIFVSHGGAAFPDLDVVLQGEGITIVLTGHTQIKKGITYSRFETIPDAPIASFELDLSEGPHSAVAAPTAKGNLCYRTITKRRKVKVPRKGHVLKRNGHAVSKTRKVHRRVRRALLMPTAIEGQNGAVVTQKTKIKVHGCKTKPARHRGRAKRTKGKAKKKTKSGKTGHKSNGGRR